MSILQLGPVIFSETDKLIQYLQTKCLLKRCAIHVVLQCSYHQGQMCLMGSGFAVLPVTNVRQSVTVASFRSRDAPQKVAGPVYWWSRNYPVTDAASEAEVSEDSACAVYKWLREVCTTRLLQPGLIGWARDCRPN